MMKRIITLLLLISVMNTLSAEVIEVTDFRHDEPIEQKMPFAVDEVDLSGKKYEQKGKIYVAHFSFENKAYTEARFTVKGVENAKVLLDGKVLDGKKGLVPNAYDVDVRYESDRQCEALKVEIEVNDKAAVRVSREKLPHHYNIYNVLQARKYSSVSLSNDGRFMLVRNSQTLSAKQTVTEIQLRNLKTGNSFQLGGIYDARWMPKSQKYYFTRKRGDNMEVVTADPLTGTQEVVADDIKSGAQVEFSPSEDWLMLTISENGPAENANVYEIVEPDDRIPGWRTRTHLEKYDLKTRHVQPLTFGYHNVYCLDISDDGRYALIGKSESAADTDRPTDGMVTVYLLDVTTMKAEMLIDREISFTNAILSPDASQIAVMGSPEIFGGIGNVLGEGVIPSLTDIQMYIMDIATKKVRPMTRDFNPNVSAMQWSRNDGKIYFTAEDKDSVNLFVMNPENGKIRQIDLPEEMVSRFALAEKSPLLAFYGNSALNSDRLYTVNTKSNAVTLCEDLSKENLKDVVLGTCKPWTFTNGKGETIYGRYYLPSDFDPSKKYPMIVNYYGGCSPTSRNFESRYPHPAYAELGYVALIINPSGATGFGQEFASRHVNTAGKGVAEDIIEGVKQFCAQHAFVNSGKIGCIGASYGGFMTQYLLTQTDIFAAGISHAGISDHTSYWGEGYWGYSYSSVSMAKSFPWKDKKLFVDQSPLFNADKVHTPLLLIHGDADTNVPVGESIQMYNALKILGRPTALVLVKGENHHILEYDKRLRWQNTLYAWFAKWLQDNDSWWNSMYPDKNL